MIRIEAVAQNGIPTKHEPFILTDKENECYWDNLKEEITSLETYENLDECKKQQQIVNLFWNATVCYIQAKTFGAFSRGKIAFVAYDVYGDFSIWVIVADNTSYSGKLYYRCFDATDMKRRDRFAWALRRKESKLMPEKIRQELDKRSTNSYE